MSNRKIIALIIGAIVVGVIFFMYNRQAKQDQAIRSLIYGYSAETLINEGGYTAARNYADSIFTEMYCNKEGIVYQYAFRDNKIDIPHRQLEIVAYRGNANENHLYFFYAIPTVKFSQKDGKESKTDWEYTGSYKYAVIDMRNLAHNGERSFSCNNFKIITEDSKDVIKECIKLNSQRIPSDDIQRKMIDYGVIFNSNEDFATYMADREKDRIGDYLLAMQKDNAAKYSLSTTSNNEIVSTPAYLTDQTETIAGASGARPTPTPVTAVHPGAEPVVMEPVVNPTKAPEPTKVPASPTPTPRVKPERERPDTQVIPKEGEGEGEEGAEPADNER